MDNEFNAGLVNAAKQHDVAIIEYFEKRDLPALQQPYQPAQYTPQRTATQVVFEVAKPVAALSVAAVTVSVVVSVGVAAVGAVFAFVSANAMYIGGGVFVVTTVWLFFLGRKNPETPGDNNGQSNGSEWEFYQRQEQGWRRRDG